MLLLKILKQVAPRLLCRHRNTTQVSRSVTKTGSEQSVLTVFRCLDCGKIYMTTTVYPLNQNIDSHV